MDGYNIANNIFQLHGDEGSAMPGILSDRKISAKSDLAERLRCLVPQNVVRVPRISETSPAVSSEETSADSQLLAENSAGLKMQKAVVPEENSAELEEQETSHEKRRAEDQVENVPKKRMSSGMIEVMGEDYFSENTLDLEADENLQRFLARRVRTTFVRLESIDWTSCLPLQI